MVCIPFRAGRGQPISSEQLQYSILQLLYNAGQHRTFTSQWSPIFDGWATGREIAFRLDAQITEARFALADVEALDREAWHYVEETLLGMALANLVEQKLTYPHRNSANERLKGNAYWAFRLPGDNGYCHWMPPNPAIDEAGIPDSRQLREIRANLRDHGCETLPPYMPGLLERYAKNKSGLRALR
jgi:hypothetical protein